ncbi:HNH endonuclease [Chryseobacterium sp. LC2016-27]|uniref:HNH endonuclease n=1 Tax=Chryseobacterium sp. LC2016-27 TaxID=2897326 RepID=UPI001E34CDD2|nr:HNH endonuclease [Chryseobacterium sp. LC2016-27]MCD0456341.1 HNH endonuclease [Chryseobacterium sp. LC2016-27]
MPIIKSPVKPFANYKWRWAVLTPTESLNEPPIFLGVLRVFNKFKNYAPSSEQIMNGLAVVQQETRSNVDLVRTRERNLIRNSGQYWKALGLLDEAHGRVLVSPFGQLLADGKITQVEFATTVVKTLELPNKKITADTSEWDEAGLRIKPLELILDTLVLIAEKLGSYEAYITPFELVRIVIPLAGAKAPLEDFAEAIIQHRQGLIDISRWPDCAPSSNDKRMAREFLIFLSNYGFCQKVSITRGNENERYQLVGISKEELVELHQLNLIQSELEKVVKEVRITQIPANIDRKRVSRMVLERPYQNVFRKNILSAFGSSCIVTGASIDNVLEAAHIKPVEYQGDDTHHNGLCLRSDIHQLFDSNNLRILPSGELIVSEAASTKNNYANLPSQIDIPNFINKEFLDWRVKYY